MQAYSMKNNSAIFTNSISDNFSAPWCKLSSEGNIYLSHPPITDILSLPSPYFLLSSGRSTFLQVHHLNNDPYHYLMSIIHNCICTEGANNMIYAHINPYDLVYQLHRKHNIHHLWENFSKACTFHLLLQISGNDDAAC